MGILYKHYFGSARLLRLSNVEENPGPRASRRSCRVVYVNIRGLHRNLSALSLTARGGDMVFCSVTLVSSMRHISELMVEGYGRPTLLLKDEVDRFRGFALYVRESFPTYRRRSYECGCCEVIVVRICSSSHNFYVFGVHRNPDL